MLKRSLLVALRLIFRNPVSSIFTITGLAVGLTTFHLLVFYIQKETSFDTHHRHADRLYRVINHYKAGNDDNKTAWTPPALASSLSVGVPEIKEAARLFRYRSPVVLVDRITGKHFTEPNSIWTDANVFQLFAFTFVAGDGERALSRPHTMVITRSMAKKYFGDADPIGRMLSDITMNADFEITAVIEDMPETSHFKVDFICALSTLPSLWGAQVLNDWGNSFLYTYIRTKEKADAAAIGSSINRIVARHLPSNDNYSAVFELQPVTDIHLRSNVLNEWQPNSDVRYIYILSTVAALILAVSMINYLNIWIARSDQRTKEIGVRRAIGGSRWNLGLQFSVESITYIALSLIFSFALVNFCSPLIAKLLDERLLMMPHQLSMWAQIFTGVIGVTLIVMIYPLRLISRTNPALAIKGKQVTTHRGGRLWNGLVVFQILVTTCLITGTILISRQLSFIREQSPGYDADHLISISQMSNSTLRERLKDALLKNRHVKNVSGISHAIGGTLYQSGYQVSVGGRQESVMWQRIHTDHDFCRTFAIPILAGRDFSQEIASDSSNFIINVTAAHALGVTPDEAIGLEIEGGGNARGKVIGVMEDFHFKTLHTAIEPLIIHIVPDRIRMLAVNIDASDQATISTIENTWKQLQPEEPFVFTTARAFNAGNYAFENKFSTIITFFTMVALVLSVIGLVTLNIYVGNLRRREIGIRRILGANTSGLILRLSGRFALITVTGLACSLPVSWLGLNSWLEGFAYRTELTAGIFITGAVITFASSMLSIALPTWKAATTDAATVLRSND